MSSLEKGGHYTDLPDSFIIFFCPFDYPSKGLPVYTFKTICSENNAIVLQDGITKVIINSTAADKTPDPELKAFLEYMNGIQQGLRQGIQQGKSLGLAEGSRQKALETARILKQLGDSVKKIMQATSLRRGKFINQDILKSAIIIAYMQLL